MYLFLFSWGYLLQLNWIEFMDMDFALTTQIQKLTSRWDDMIDPTVNYVIQIIPWTRYFYVKGVLFSGQLYDIFGKGGLEDLFWIYHSFSYYVNYYENKSISCFCNLLMKGINMWAMWMWVKAIMCCFKQEKWRSGLWSSPQKNMHAR